MSVREPKRFGCRAILFDLDGVLVDSTHSVERAWRVWAERHDLDGDEVLTFAHGRRTEEVVRHFASHLDAEEETRNLEKAEIETVGEVSRFEGALDLLSALPSGSWAVVTSGTRDLATARLTATGLPVPEILVGADDVEKGKPDPGPYLEGARSLGVPPEECVVVEDSPAGIRAAHSAGMLAIAVSTTHSGPELSEADVLIRDLRDIRLDRAGESGMELSVSEDRDLSFR